MALPPFLCLPGELRNRIYDYALIEPKQPIVVRAKKTRPPGLLSTCKLIRKEAITIWITRNSFMFETINYNASFFAKWQKHFFNYCTNSAGANVKAKWDGVVNWFNVVECCEILFRAGVMYEPIALQEKDQAQIWVAALFLVYDGVKYGKTWNEVKFSLELLYVALKAANRRTLV